VGTSKAGFIKWLQYFHGHQPPGPSRRRRPFMKFMFMKTKFACSFIKNNKHKLKLHTLFKGVSKKITDGKNKE
jgi:hypothetical protein